MGMTIDKTIEFFNGLECYTPQAKDAKDMAIETMRKYQKIQEVMNSRPDDDAKSNSKALSEIEVIMYGDNN